MDKQLPTVRAIGNPNLTSGPATTMSAHDTEQCTLADDGAIDGRDDGHAQVLQCDQGAFGVGLGPADILNRLECLKFANVVACHERRLGAGCALEHDHTDPAFRFANLHASTIRRSISRVAAFRCAGRLT